MEAESHSMETSQGTDGPLQDSQDTEREPQDVGASAQGSQGTGSEVVDAAGEQGSAETEGESAPDESAVASGDQSVSNNEGETRQTSETADANSVEAPESGSAGDRIIENALRMMEDPRIVAKQRGDDGLRAGWEKLKTIFELAAPSFLQVPGWEERNLKDSTDVGSTGIPHWCGIFALWAIKESGIDVGVWRMGSGIASVQNVQQVRDLSRLQRGDIGYLDQPFNHHFLVQEVHDGGTIDTIDGNSGAEGAISTKTRQPISKFTAFYTVLVV
jgi:hypothetical protein